jgi:hypothetical protein
MHTKRSFLLIAALIMIMALCTGPVSAAYAHNESVWTPSGSQFIREGFETSVTAPDHLAPFFSFMLKPSYPAVIVTPITVPYIRDGARPKVRYLYFAQNMPVGVNVTHITAYSGPAKLADKDITWKGNGDHKVYTLDLGTYKNVNQGINTYIVIENTRIDNQNVVLYGSGAKLEW